MKKQIQLEFFKRSPRFFGGHLLHGRRRGRRPLSTREAVHLVMRSSWAKGQHSFLHPSNRRQIDAVVAEFAHRHGVRVYRSAIVPNHIHLVLRLPKRPLYRAFIRALSSKIACHVMRGKSFKDFLKQVRGEGYAATAAAASEPQGKGQRFFQFRPFSRVLGWGRDFRQCCQYVAQNVAEAMGFAPYKVRPQRYARWLDSR